MAIEQRLKTLDEKGHRKDVHPAEVKGTWHRRRKIVQGLLMTFFLVLPWIRISGRPALLLDIVERKFSVFGILFRAHDVPIIFLLVLSFLLSFALITALFGRVWCGWSCPQTVFIETVFRAIERLMEGNAFERRKNTGAPLTGERLLRKAGKWFLYSIASLIITHSVLAIFVGTDRLARLIAEGPGSSPGAFGFIVISTAVVLFDFGWLREQFCILACPYGRIQSLFQDRHTLTVAYDMRRGEPRGAKRTVSATVAPPSGEYPPKEQVLGDCVNCFRCVNACPTGIDIRDGSAQLECIACTACMDACDDVMKRLGRPLGLIRYQSMDEAEPEPLSEAKASVEANAPEVTPAKSRIHARPVIYATLLVVAITGLVTVVARRNLAMVEVFKTRGAPFVEVTDELKDLKYANLFVTEVSNQNDDPIEIEFKLEKNEADGFALVMPNNPVRLGPGEFLRNPFTVRFAKEKLSMGRTKVKMEIFMRSAASENRASKNEKKEEELTLVGPF